ncbi:tRNA lysidine(34) synthetase TilS [Hymenobacter sp. BT186]|uniref:tRNA(Ile)-lysidine synthase n=1 Tax=Hymenobacter telluris TaxID=2816474 RepID=A0A939ET77_9BACT|nr:tRNA lysidine(34) synthetase TilS [Hymenobacter telluris]MBO0357329.1 tRNA lysidine(34) synthetase TilS [Hymenobacter telluris]MBW3373355.1 tRNA lysidine(34) synthetase TilS [Hymenobacter norwichensis]
MLDQVRQYIEQHQLFSLTDDPLLVAVSGGQDSVVLADVLHRLGVPFAVAHCHFGLRGEEADADEQFVRKLAKKYEVPYFAEFFQTKAFAEQEGISTQMAARALRYEWFERLRQTQNLAYIATAHHQRDAAETMLLNLTHGTGLAGLHGIPPKNGYLVRPLLGIGKPELFEYLVENHLIWREDASNDSPVYQRNRLRQEVLPVLRDINPNLDQTLQFTAERVGGAEEIVRRYVADTAAEAQRTEADATYLNIATLQRTAATTLVLHELLRPFGFSFPVVKDIVAAFLAEPGRRFESPTHRLVKDREQLVITRKIVTKFGTHQIQAGQEVLKIDGLHLRLELAEAAGLDIPRGKAVAALDADLLKFPLIVRPWQEGDWFMPIGMKGKKKLSDFLIDQKVPLNLKDNVFVLVSADGKIAWVIGFRPDERFKVTDATERVLTVKRM